MTMQSENLASRRVITMALTGVLSFGVLTACSGQTGEGPTTPTQTADDAAPNGDALAGSWDCRRFG